MIKVDHDVAQIFGGADKLDARVAAFIKAREDHRQTENVPAPTEHPVIERIVKDHDGRYTVLDPVPEPEPPETPTFEIEPIPEPPGPQTLEEWRSFRLAELVAMRNRKRSAGVQYGSNWYWSDLGSLVELAIVKDIARDDPNYTVKWKTREGEFVILGEKDFSALVVKMRAHTQTCFNIEARLNTKLRSYSLPKLASLDLEEMWVNDGTA